MNIIHKIFLLLLCSCQLILTQAQDATATKIHLSTDQRVYIAGETAWINGWLENFSESKTIHLKLLDRFGKKRQEIVLKNDSGNFKCFLSLPNELTSEYYFVEASIAGYASVQSLHPIMVINPTAAASACNDTIQLNKIETKDIEPKFTIKTDKNLFSNRENVIIHLSELDRISRIYVSAIKKDELSDYMDSLLSYSMPIRNHAARGVVEKEGHHLTIKLVSKDTGQPLPQTRAFAAVIGRQASLSSGLSNNQGDIEFILPLMQQDASLVFFTDKQLENKVRILTPDEDEANLPISFPCLQLNPNMTHAIEDRIWNSKAGLLYHGKDRGTINTKNLDSTDFYGKPDKRYLLDEYVRYPVLEEVIAEFIHEARVKEAGNGTDKTIQVLNTPAKAFFNSQALTLLDGVPIMNAGKLLELNPLLIQSIDVVARKYYLGDTTWNGIIHFKTYNNDLSEFVLPSSYLLYPLKGLQETAIPMQMQHPNQEKRIPLLSNLVFNQTFVLSNKNSLQVEFTTNDALGQFQINCVGINGKGETSRKQITIDVKEPR